MTTQIKEREKAARLFGKSCAEHLKAIDAMVTAYINEKDATSFLFSCNPQNSRAGHARIEIRAIKRTNGTVDLILANPFLDDPEYDKLPYTDYFDELHAPTRHFSAHERLAEIKLRNRIRDEFRSLFDLLSQVIGPMPAAMSMVFYRNSRDRNKKTQFSIDLTHSAVEMKNAASTYFTDKYFLLNRSADIFSRIYLFLGPFKNDSPVEIMAVFNEIGYRKSRAAKPSIVHVDDIRKALPFSRIHFLVTYNTRPTLPMSKMLISRHDIPLVARLLDIKKITFADMISTFSKNSASSGAKDFSRLVYHHSEPFTSAITKLKECREYFISEEEASLSVTGKGPEMTLAWSHDSLQIAPERDDFIQVRKQGLDSMKVIHDILIQIAKTFSVEVDLKVSLAMNSLHFCILNFNYPIFTANFSDSQLPQERVVDDILYRMALYCFMMGQFEDDSDHSLFITEKTSEKTSRYTPFPASPRNERWLDMSLPEQLAETFEKKMARTVVARNHIQAIISFHFPEWVPSSSVLGKDPRHLPINNDTCVQAISQGQKNLRGNREDEASFVCARAEFIKRKDVLAMVDEYDSLLKEFAQL